MKYLVLISISLMLLLSCANSQQNESDSSKVLYNEKHFIYQDDILEFIHKIPSDTIIEQENNYIKKKKGQILYVNNYVIRTPSYRIDSTNKEIKSSSVIQLTGWHSPSTQILTAYITFKKEGDLKEPHYNENERTLRIEMRYEELIAVFSILENPKIQLVCWYGEFDNGHIFSELYRYSSVLSE